MKIDIPSELNWPIDRLVTKGIGSLIEIERDWSFWDVWRMNLTINAIEKAEHEARRKSEQR